MPTAGDLNLAQLRLYGAMLVLADETLDDLSLRLVYLHPAKPDETAFEETARRDELIGYFETTCAIFAAWVTTVGERVAARDRQLAALNFPYGNFRTDQRRVAKHLFRAFRDGEHWLVEAPTGSGKTMAGLFAALKAMGTGALDRLAFLTSRTTGQQAVEEALADVVEVLDGEPALSAVTVTAKDRICFSPGAPCDPENCEYAKGYYDRMPAARRHLLRGGLVRRAQIEAAAREHQVCPFELSVDVMAWADVVGGDYNYVFDPIVRLGRMENLPFSRVGLIGDEAHQLGDRVRDMLGATLSRRSVKSGPGRIRLVGFPGPMSAIDQPRVGRAGRWPVGCRGRNCQAGRPAAGYRSTVGRADRAVARRATVPSERIRGLRGKSVPASFGDRPRGDDGSLHRIGRGYRSVGPTGVHGPG